MNRHVGSVVCAALLISGCSSSYRKLPVGYGVYPTVAGSAVQPIQEPLAEYRIGPRDILDLRVFGEKDLSVEQLPVSSGGSVSVPLLGEIRAVGLTTAELATTVDQRLASGKYLKAPHTSISVTKAINYTFTLDGAVNKPGVYDIPGRLTLLQAMSIGDGAAQYSKLDEVVVVREINGQRYAARFDLNEIRAGRSPDLPIRQGDVVIVGYDALDRLFHDVLATLPVAAALFVAIKR